MEFRLLKADEIEVRVGNVTSKGYTLLLYKNARADMNILDETLGVEGWQREHYECKGNLFCRVGIRTSNGEWIWKSDCGVESNTEKEKGEASDSFKRACTNVGIGRELYTSPFIFISCATNFDGKSYKLPDEEKYRKFKVNLIDYVARKITKLVISDVKTGEIVFTFGTKQKQEMPTQLEEVEIKGNKEKDTCWHCAAVISEKVADYSIKKFGLPLCYDCQRLPKQEYEKGVPDNDCGDDELPF